MTSWSKLPSKQQGLIGLGAAIAFFTANGYTVSTPLNDSQDYDLVVDNGTLERVQVKTTRRKSDHGFYQVSLKSSGGTAGTIYSRVGEGSCKLLFVHTEAGENYLIPVDVVRRHRSAVTLGEAMSVYRV